MSWGYRITLVFTAFVGFMGFMVWKSFGENIELVTADYYDQELRYESSMIKSDNYRSLNKEIGLMQTPEGLVIQLPDTSARHISIRLMRPSDSSLDRQFEMEAAGSGTFSIPKENLHGGFYRLKVEWKKDEKEYQADLPLVVED